MIISQAQKHLPPLDTNSHYNSNSKNPSTRVLWLQMTQKSTDAQMPTARAQVVKKDFFICEDPRSSHSDNIPRGGCVEIPLRGEEDSENNSACSEGSTVTRASERRSAHSAFRLRGGQGRRRFKEVDSFIL